MLVGSDLGVAAGILEAPRTRLTERRVRLMNLGGVLGGAAGLGLVGLARVDDARAAAAFLGTGSVVGALIALRETRPRELAFAPIVDAAPDATGRLRPRVGVRWTF
jgi:hypothetical protein